MWPLQKQQWVLPCNCLVGANTIFALRQRDCSPCAELGLSTPNNMIKLDNHHGDLCRKKKKRYPGCLINSSRGGWHVLQPRCQPTPIPIYTNNVAQRRCQPKPTITYIYCKGDGGGGGGSSFHPPFPRWGGGFVVSCMTVVRYATDPRIPTMPGWSMSGLNLPGRHHVHQARSVVRCSAGRTKGKLQSCQELLVRRT